MTTLRDFQNDAGQLRDREPERMRRNAAKAGYRFDWRNHTRIEDPGRGRRLAEDPFDLIADAERERPQRLRTSNRSYGRDDKKDALIARLYAAFDDLLADLDDEEEVEPQQRRAMDSRRSYVCDAATATVARYVDPNSTVEDALASLGNRLALRQKDRSVLGYWVGLKHYLTRSVQAGTRIRQCNPATLAALLRPLAENVVN